MAAADLYFRLGNYELAKSANIDVIQAINKVYELARARKDYYLFTDEPDVDGDDDFEFVQTVPDPLKVDFVAHMKALQSLAAFRLAVCDQQGANPLLLKEAESWAGAALENKQVDGVDVPSGHNPENPVGLYVLGVANEVIGVELTRTSPCNAGVHAKAKPYFDAANDYLNQAVTLIADKYGTNRAITEMGSEIHERQRHLGLDNPRATRSSMACPS